MTSLNESNSSNPSNTMVSSVFIPREVLLSETRFRSTSPSAASSSAFNLACTQMQPTATTNLSTSTSALSASAAPFVPSSALLHFIKPTLVENATNPTIKVPYPDEKAKSQQQQPQIVDDKENTQSIPVLECEDSVIKTSPSDNVSLPRSQIQESHVPPVPPVPPAPAISTVPLFKASTISSTLEQPELYIPMMVDTASCEEVHTALESCGLGKVDHVERIINRNNTISYYAYMRKWETTERAVQFREAIQNGEHQVLVNQNAPHILLRVYKKKASTSSSKYGFHSTRTAREKERDRGGKRN